MRTGALTDGMKWRIIRTDSGAYVLSVKSSGSNYYVLNVNATMPVNNAELLQDTYTYDNIYRDEWHIVPFIRLGLSTDNYAYGCGNEPRGSYRYANSFINNINLMLGGLQKTSIHHYNKGSSTSASKSDFSENGAISNDIDFMIYIGHGHNAHNELGNHLHYDCGILGTPHVKNDDGTYSYCNPDGNAYTSEMRFGSGTSALRWVWLYTCNFLAINEYVSNYSLMEMMTGAHIVMGYETQAYLCDAMVTKFAEYLSTGESIIRAYFKAGTDGEATATEDHHIMKIIFIRQAQNETIYSPAIHYEYDITDIMIITHDIQENFE